MSGERFRQKFLKEYRGKFPLLEQEMDKIINMKSRKKRIEELKRFLPHALEDFEIDRREVMIQEQGSAVKTFEVKESFTRSGRCRITVTFRGKVIKVFTKDTMRQVRMAFYRDGYELIAWREGRRIVCQDPE